MQWRWGGYLFPANAVSHRTAKATLFNNAGAPYAERVTVALSGTLSATGQAACATQQALLDAASRLHFQDLVLIRDDGGIAMRLATAGSTTGVRVTGGPNWQAGGAEYSTFITFSDMTFEAEYPLPVGNPYLSFEETLSGEGGGPEYAYMVSPGGGLVRWRPYAATTYRTAQRGQAVGMYSRPEPPPPYWPQWLVRGPGWSKTSAKRVGATIQGYGITWEYVYESPVPLVGEPAPGV